MNVWVGLASGIVFVYVYGLVVLYLLGYDQKDILKRPYLIFCYGSGSISLFMFTSALFKVTMSLKSNVVSLLVLFFVAVARWFAKGKDERGWSLFSNWQQKVKSHIGPYQKVLYLMLMLLIVFEISYLGSRSLLEPETSFDGRVRWGLCAKVLHSEGGLYTEYFDSPKENYNVPLYPLLVPLEIASTYYFMGEMNARLVKVLFVVYFVMLILAFYDLARRYLSALGALIFTAFLATVPPFFKGEGSASTCMADVPLAFFGFICVMLLLSTLKQKRGVMVIPAGMALFFCAFTKAEGLYYSLIFMFSVFVASFVEDKASRGVLFKHTVLMAGLLLILYTPWLIFRLGYIKIGHPNFPDAITIGYVISKIHRLSFIIPRLVEECFFVYRWHVIWGMFAVSLICISKKGLQNKEIIYLLSVVLGFFAFWTVTYMLSAWWGRFDDRACSQLMDITMFRLFLHLIPIVVLSSVVCLSRNNSGETGHVLEQLTGGQ